MILSVTDIRAALTAFSTQPSPSQTGAQSTHRWHKEKQECQVLSILKSNGLAPLPQPLGFEQSLWLVFVSNIKDTAVLQTPKDTSLLTLHQDDFSSFVGHRKQDLSLLHQHPAPHAGHHRIIKVGKALQDH